MHLRVRFVFCAPNDARIAISCFDACFREQLHSAGHSQRRPSVSRLQVATPAPALGRLSKDQSWRVQNNMTHDPFLKFISLESIQAVRQPGASGPRRCSGDASMTSLARRVMLDASASSARLSAPRFVLPFLPSPPSTRFELSQGSKKVQQQLNKHQS